MKAVWIACMVIIACVGCGGAEEESFGQTQQADNNTAVVSYCTWAQSSYWCQDFYTKGWCTNGVNERAWDYTRCTWTGWNSDGNFCGTNYPGYAPTYDGWEWTQTHIHCN
jgi:hypothetical protein